MKNKKTMLYSILIIGVVIVSFFAGTYVKEQEYSNSRVQRCKTLISFALDKVENGDISDQDTMEALISNIYAAYEVCDDPGLKSQLHDLWNVLIFDGDSYTVIKDILSVELRSVGDGLSRNEE